MLKGSRASGSELLGYAELTLVNFHLSKGMYLTHFEVYLFIYLFIFRATPTAYGGSQARGLIIAVAAGLHHSHTNSGSEPHLRPTPQLTATMDP